MDAPLRQISGTKRPHTFAFQEIDSEENEQITSPLASLPVELIVFIFSFLTNNWVAPQLSRFTCRKLYRIISPPERKFSLCDQIARQGDLHLLKWSAQFFKFNKDTFGHAAFGGSLPVLEWLYENGCPRCPNSILSAAEAGQVNAIKWLIDHNFPRCENTFDFAAEGGHLAVMELLFKLKFPFNEETFEYGVDSGNTLVVRWLLEKECPRNERSACKTAAESGNFQMLKFLHQNRFDWDVSTLSGAAISLSDDIIFWLRNKGLEWQPIVFTACAAFDLIDEHRFSFLQLLHDHGCPWDHHSMNAIVEKGTLEHLIWAREEGCPWNVTTTATAAAVASLEKLQWLRAHGCPWDTKTCFLAKKAGALDTYEWALANGAPEGEVTREELQAAGLEQFFTLAGFEEDSDGD